MRRLTIAYNTRTITLTVSDGPIVADLLPDIARRLGVLDPSIVYGGYRLITADGEPLSPSRTFAEQHVSDQSVLTLEPGASVDTDIVYDDVVEAVGASVQRVYRPWTKDHTTLTSLLISVGMLAISAGWLALFPVSIWNAALGIGFSVVLIALAALLHSKTMTVQATVIGLTASVFAAVGGYQLASYLVPDQAFHTLPLVGASAGLLVSGCLMAVAAPSTRPYGFHSDHHRPVDSHSGHTFHIAAFMDGEHLDHCDDVRLLGCECTALDVSVVRPHQRAKPS